MKTLRARAASVALLLPVAAALGACSFSVGGGYDAADVEAQVTAAQEEATPDLEVSDTTCPDDVDTEVDATFECTLLLAGVEAPYTITITAVEDSTVSFDLAPSRAIISVDLVEDFLEQQQADQGFDSVVADCGDPRVVVQDPQTTFTCTLTNGDATKDVTMLVEDLDGTVTVQS